MNDGTTSDTPLTGSDKSSDKRITKKRKAPKLAYGQGSAFYWRGRCAIEHRVNGKSYREVADSWPEAEAARDARRRKVELQLETGGDITIGQLLDDWYEYDAEGQPGTLRNYLESMRKIKAELGADTPLRDISVADIEAMFARFAHRQHRPLGRQSLRVLRLHLVKVYRRAVRMRQASENVAELSELPARIPNTYSRPRRSLERTEFEMIRERLAWNHAGTYERALLVALLTGLRAGEVLGLRWENVDLDEHMLRVESSLGYQDTSGRKWAVTGDLKTTASRRTMQLPVDLVAALRSERAEQRERRMLTEHYGDTSLVFASAGGNPLSHGNLRRALRRICDELSIPETTTHELRTSFLSYVIDAGLSLPAAAAAAGHVNTRMVASRYAKPLDAVQPTAAIFDAD